MRDSITNWVDCVGLMRKITPVLESLTEYTAGGCKVKGMGNDFMLCVRLHDLKNTIDEILTRKTLNDKYIDMDKR